MRVLVYLIALLIVGTAVAQNPTIIQGSYITNVFGNSNFVLNPNARTDTTNVVPVNATVTRSTTTPLVATSEFLVTTSTSTGTISWPLRVFDQGMKGQNCEARFSYRGFSVGSTTAQIVQGSNVVAQLTLTPSTDPRIASINFPCGDLSAATTFRLQQATASLTGTNKIGGIYVGLATNMANVAQAEMVGGGEWTALSRFSRPANVTQATYAAFTAGVGNYTTGAVIGKATTAGSDTTITFPYLPAGEYQVVTNLSMMLLDQQQVGECKFSIQEIDSNTYNGQTFSGNVWTSGIIYTPSSMLVGRFNFTSGGQRRFRIVSLNNAAGAVSGCVATTDTTSNKAGIYVYRFPSSSELVVTPERQNVFGGVVYTNQNQSLFAGSAEPTAFSPYTNATWNQPTLLKGKAAVTTTNSGNDLGFSISNLPVGNYKLDVTGLLNASVGAGTTTGTSTICNFKLVETTTSTDVARQVHQDQQYGAAVGNEVRNYVNAFTGVFTNTSVATRNFRIESQKHFDTTTGNIGNCQAFSAISGGNNTNISIIMTPLDQPSNSALYVEGPVKASATGAAIPTGYVGEMKQSTVSFTNIGLTTYTNLNTVTLTRGVWSCSSQARIARNGATVPASFEYVSCVGNSTSGNCDLGYAIQTIGNSYQAGISNTFNYLQVGSQPIVVRYDGSNFIFSDGTISASATGNISQKIYLDASAGTPQALGRLECVRIN